MDPTAGIFATLADPTNAAVLALAFAVIFAVVRFVPPKVMGSEWAVRTLPVLPIPICMAVVWIPGLSASSALACGDRLALGAALGCALMATHKIWMQTVLGHDKRIEDIRAARALPDELTPTKPGAPP